jgi:hypothetical protein
MTHTKDEALKLVKTWFERNTYGDEAVEVYEAIEQAIAEAEKHEPVAWLSTDCIGERYLCFTKPQDSDPVQPLYTTPPQRTWVGLTDEDRRLVRKWTPHNQYTTADEYAEAVQIETEKTLKEKNT